MMRGCPIEIDGHHFDVPAHLLGLIDPDTPWGEGLEQQERSFARQVTDAFGTAERINEIVSYAAIRRRSWADEQIGIGIQRAPKTHEA